MKTITVIDFETGGFDAKTKQITEVGMLNFDLETFTVNWEYQAYIKPYGDYQIDPIVYTKTQVTEKDVLYGDDAKTVYKEMVRHLKAGNSSNGKPQGNTMVAGHNFTAFDLPFAEEFFEFFNDDFHKYIGTILDTLPMGRGIWPGQPNTLSDCCKRIGFDLVGAHGALDDVRGNFQLLKFFLLKLRESGAGVVVQDKTTKQRKYFNF